jgi:hypothetical protein
MFGAPIITKINQKLWLNALNSYKLNKQELNTTYQKPSLQE